MQWKGYSKAHNRWEPEGNMHAPELIKEFWDKNLQDTKALRDIKEEQEEADSLIIQCLSTTMSSDHSTSSSSSDVVMAFIESIIADLTPSMPPTNDQELTNVPIEETPSDSTSLSMLPLLVVIKSDGAYVI
jgi:hypothetical protein